MRKPIDDPVDAVYMQRVMELAREGIGLTSPNPCVGAVVVNDNGEIIGEGAHTYDGRKHAEVLALEDAGDEARGATLYLNLEPCSHTGRTPPCVDSVIAAGIRRVVAAMVDPNPLVAGNGFNRLCEAGIEVDVGAGEREARALNESFAKFIRTRQPFVTLKAAMTLDGRIAPAPGALGTPSALGSGNAERGWITGEIARKHVHQLRHASDAILVGVGTVVADDPLLTDRSGLPRRRQLMRVILDSGLRIPIASRLLETADHDVMVFCSHGDQTKAKELNSRGVCVEHVSADASGRPQLTEVMARLGQTEITSVLIEGGSGINAQAIASGVVDKVFLYYAPKILGSGAVPFLAAGDTGSDLLDVKITDIHRFGEDFAIEGYVRDPYDQKGS